MTNKKYLFFGQYDGQGELIDPLTTYQTINKSKTFDIDEFGAYCYTNDVYKQVLDYSNQVVMDFVSGVERAVNVDEFLGQSDALKVLSFCKYGYIAEVSEDGSISTRKLQPEDLDELISNEEFWSYRNWELASLVELNLMLKYLKSTYSTEEYEELWNATEFIIRSGSFSFADKEKYIDMLMKMLSV